MASPNAGRVYIIAGPPASGKGTQCKQLAAELGLVHLSTGDIFRAAVAAGTELGLQAKGYLDTGQFVPDEMVITFIKSRLAQPDVEANGCMLDGFPRTEAQARALLENVSVERFILMQVPNRALQKRAAERRIDPTTGEIYNLTFRPPPADIASRMVTRQYDDDTASFQVRLDTFHAHIRRILPVFDGKVWRVDGMRPVAEVFADLKRCLEAGPAAAAAVAPPVDVPDSFKCPISLEVMTDPVSTSDGHAYERAYIVEWLKSHATSPKTGAVLPDKRVTPAHALRNAIEDWAEGRGAVDPTPDPAAPAADPTPDPAASAAHPLGATTMDDIASADAGLLDGEWPEDVDPVAAAAAAAAAAEEAWPEDGGGGGGDVDGLTADITLEAVVAPATAAGGGAAASTPATPYFPKGAKVQIVRDGTQQGNLAVVLGPYKDAVKVVMETGPDTGVEKSYFAHELKRAVGADPTAASAGAVFRPVLVRVNPKDSAADKTPTDVCCVVDVSGSMGSMAMYETADGRMKHDGLNILDLVKHAINTVAHILGPEDRLSVVPFSTTAEVCVAPTFMTEAGRKELMAKVDLLRPNGRTNIWDGCLKGMEALRAPAGADTPAADKMRRKTLLLLTDGQPNIAPPRGHVPEVLDYKDKYPDFQFQMNTFGFGYDLNSELLLELAEEGNGTYAFIPDAVILGTVFVNSIANVVATKAQQVTLSLVPKHGATFSGATPGEEATTTEESWGRQMMVGPLQFGQPRTFVVPMMVPAGIDADFLDATLTYKPIGATAEEKVVASTEARARGPAEEHALLRSETVARGYAAVLAAVGNRGRAAQQMAQSHADAVKASPAVTDGRVVALKSDCEGRMLKALNGKARFDRWGKHYLRALIRAHQLEVCTNFMDPGLQVYGGALFKQLRDRGDKVFLELPAPKPQTLLPSRASGGRPAASAASYTPPATTHTPPARTTNMQTYYAGAGGGCFGPDATVVRVGPDGSSPAAVPIAALHRGDLVRLAGGGYGAVVCTVRIARPAAKPLLQLAGSGLTVTPKHPIRVNGAWTVPAALPATAVPHDGFVHTLVVDRGHVVLVNGMECVTWGHGLTDEAVAHPFYGSFRRVVANLSRLPGWAAGRVEVNGCIRAAESGGIEGFTCSRQATIAGSDLIPALDLASVPVAVAAGC